MNYIIFNKELVKENEVKISPQDRGFRYGDGIFDTLIVNNGKLYQLNWHLDRMSRSLKSIHIEFDLSVLPALFQKLLTANNFTDGLLRIQITRGIGGRGYLPNEKTSPTLIIETLPAPQIEQQPISLWQSSYQKISSSALPVQFKLCQGLNSTLARIEGANNNCFDALMINEKNQICETSSANIFWFKNGELYTPSLSCGVLEGSIRAAVIRLWQGKMHEVMAGIEVLKEADAVFITNVAWKILAVSAINPISLQWKNISENAELINEISTLLKKDIKLLE
jgi:aminodeoxychorismate lyase